MLDVLNLILPHRCVKCSRILPNDNLPLCLSCYHSLPFTHWSLNQDNPTFEAIYESADIVNASSLLFYEHNNAVKRLVMSNKYYNQPKIGQFLADLSIPILQNHDFDTIICVPSHNRTKRQRGYNQVELCAQQLSIHLDIPYNGNLIRRVKRRDSQTHKNKEERFKSLKRTFKVVDENANINKLLLVDDVLTTGATLSNCCHALHNAYPKLEISVFTLAKVI